MSNPPAPEPHNPPGTPDADSVLPSKPSVPGEAAPTPVSGDTQPVNLPTTPPANLPENPVGSGPDAYPLLASDPPKIGDFWLDARLTARPSGVAYLAHADLEAPIMLLMLSDGAAGDAAARDRLAGEVNKMHVDTVIARGGEGQHEGRLGHKFRSEDDDPVGPDDAPLAAWVALAWDNSHHALAEADRLLRSVDLSSSPPLGTVRGPDFRLHWIDRTQPGPWRLWPLSWPGRKDRAGWMTMLVSWALMLLLSTLALLIVVLLFQNPASGGGGGGGGQSQQSQSSATGSPSNSQPQSGSPSGSGSPTGSSPSSGSMSGSPSSSSGSPSQASSSLASSPGDVRPTKTPSMQVSGQGTATSTDTPPPPINTKL